MAADASVKPFQWAARMSDCSKCGHPPARPEVFLKRPMEAVKWQKTVPGPKKIEGLRGVAASVSEGCFSY